MRLGYILLILSFWIVNYSLSAQETFDTHEPTDPLQKAQEYYDLHLYGQARQSAQSYLQRTKNVNESSVHNDLTYTAKSIYYLSGLKLELTEGESKLVSFAQANEGNPKLQNVYFELGDYYYNEKQYGQCITYFDKINPDKLSQIRMSEHVFKKGYCHFVQKEFQKAEYIFSFSKDIKNKYFYPINYYYGMCQYFNDDYDAAVKSFQRVEGSSVYSKHIPYYICQIYFARKQYDRLLNYGERSILKSDVKKIENIRLLLGQAYFLNNDFERALPHLQYYEENTASLTFEEFYQLAFTQYKLGLYDDAIDNFLEINREESRLGQLVNYYLADCYLKTGDKTSARAAFKKVSQMDYASSMQEEATFNYGKLSSEMGYEREAINILVDVKSTSPYYKETQSIINDILKNSSDYSNALAIMESLPSLNKELKATYQNIAYKRAMQYLSEGNADQALALMEKGQAYAYDPTINAQVAYWRGYISMARGEHDKSLNHYNDYFIAEKKTKNLPQESAKYMANYNQGYNHLKLDEYYFAKDQFQFAIDGIESNRSKITESSILDRVLPDAYVRAGDCLFKEKKYSAARTYYDKSINSEKGEYVYALYQRALIEGLEKDNYQKIKTLQSLVENHPNSDYADDAILQLGDTYLNTDNPEPAASVYRKLVKRYKGKSNLINNAYLKLGLISYNAGDTPLALTYYKSVFDNNPNPKESQEAMLAVQEIYIDDLGKGEDYIAFVDSLPGYEIDAFARDSINYKVGENKYNNAEYVEAIKAFDIYLSKYVAGYYRLNAHYLRGECYAIDKKYAKALKDYEYIIGEGISDYYERALKKSAIISYNYTQNFNKSYKYYKELEAYTNEPEEKFEAQLGAMRSAFRIGKDNAILKYATLVNQNELSSISEKSASMYYLGKVSYKQKKYEQAITAFKQVAQLSNNNQAAEARYLIAQSYYDQRQLDAAEQQITEANKKNTAYPFWVAKSLLLMSDIFVDRQDLLNARAAVEAVIENFKEDKKLLAEANTKLQSIKVKETESNRIKIDNPDGTLQLDTSGN